MTSPSHTRNRALLAVAAVVLVVAAVAVAVSLGRGGSSSSTARRTHPTSSPSTAPAPTSPPADFVRAGEPDPHHATTAKLATRVFRELPVPQGARRHSSAPVAALRTLQIVPGTAADTIRRIGWWTWSGTPDAALRDFGRRVPQLLADGGSSGPISGVRTHWFEGGADAATADLIVGFSTFATAQGVAIRVDMFASVRPSRTVDSFIPPPSSVVVRYSVVHRRPPAPATVTSRTFRGAVAQDLANRVNALYAQAIFAASCGPARADRTEVTLTFHTASGTFVTTSAGCYTLQLRSPAKTFSELMPGTIDDHVRTLLGLPSS